MSEFNVPSRKCPVCREAAVVRLGGGLNVKGATHRCGKCGAQLKTSLTRPALWGIPVAAVSFAGMYFAFDWLQQAQSIAPVVRAGLAGIIGALAFSIPAKIIMRNIVFQTYK
jgi:hypothetical protein